MFGMRTGVALPINHQHHAHVPSSRTDEYATKVCDHTSSVRCVMQSSAQKSGHISTSRLNALLRFHLKPINLVIFQEPHNDS